MARTNGIRSDVNHPGWQELDRFENSEILASIRVHRSPSLGTRPNTAEDRGRPPQADEAASEEARMELVRRGDVRAFEATVEREWSRTLLYARYLLGDQDQDQAMDAAQEAFARLWRTRERWQAGGSVGAWLLRTVRNFVFSERRKRRVHQRWASLTGSHERKTPRTPLQETETQEVRVAIEQAIERLPPRRREVFVLFYLQSRTYREIAEIMDIRPQSVGNYLQAALADLRSELHRFFPGPSASNRQGDPNDPPKSA